MYILNSKPAAARWRHIYGCYRKHLVASHGFVELCFPCSEWIVSEEEWKDHCQAHLDKPDTVPTQCNPLIYGGTLASPGYCPFCLGDESLPATTRMHQFLVQAEWRDHIHQHLENLGGIKAPKCPLHKP